MTSLNSTVYPAPSPFTGTLINNLIKVKLSFFSFLIAASVIQFVYTSSSFRTSASVLHVHFTLPPHSTTCLSNSRLSLYFPSVCIYRLCLSIILFYYYYLSAPEFLRLPGTHKGLLMRAIIIFGSLSAIVLSCFLPSLGYHYLRRGFYQLSRHHHAQVRHQVFQKIPCAQAYF